jgi:hypothetical protein
MIYAYSFMSKIALRIAEGDKGTDSFVQIATDSLREIK